MLLTCCDFKTAHLITLTFTLFEAHTGTVNDLWRPEAQAEEAEGQQLLMV